MDESRVDVINQVFSLFRINFHNQFYAAYADSETLNQAKRLWFQSLQGFKDATLLRAAKRIIEQSEYLPTLHRFLECCDKIEFALPSAREAYLEACLHRNAGKDSKWSHSLVYHAARASGWHFLRSQPESKALPVFTQNFNELARQLRDGKQFDLPALPPSDDAGKQNIELPPIAERQKKMRDLREELALDKTSS